MARKLNARDHLKKAIKYYLEVDGASNIGSYRDVITDTLHLAFKDKKLRKEWVKPDKGVKDNANWDATLKDQLLWAGYDNYNEERENKELRKLNLIPAKDLPLYIDHPWEFVADEFEKRLKNAKQK